MSLSKWMEELIKMAKSMPPSPDFIALEEYDCRCRIVNKDSTRRDLEELAHFAGHKFSETPFPCCDLKAIWEYFYMQLCSGLTIEDSKIIVKAGIIKHIQQSLIEYSFGVRK